MPFLRLSQSQQTQIAGPIFMVIGLAMSTTGLCLCFISRKVKEAGRVPFPVSSPRSLNYRCESSSGRRRGTGRECVLSEASSSPCSHKTSSLSCEPGTFSSAVSSEIFSPLTMKKKRRRLRAIPKKKKHYSGVVPVWKMGCESFEGP